MLTKVVFLIRDLNYAGAQRQLVTLAKGLDKQYFDVTVLYFYAGGPLAKELEINGIKAICLDKKERWDVIPFFKRLVGYLREIKPNILHGYLGESNLLCIFLKPFFPKTRMIWGIRESDTDPSLYGWLGSLLSYLECKLARFADLIISNSYAGKYYHQKLGFPEQKMIVIPNGINIERFVPLAEAGKKVRKEWEIPEDIILIGKVGRLDPMKDHTTFLQAAALICETRRDVRFVCVGTGPQIYALQLHQLADKLGIKDKVIWSETRGDMTSVFNSFDIATSASAYGEGFGNVIGEAMACSVPCVVTDVGDSKMIVGDTGIVVPPKNPQALANAWLKTLENNKKSSLAIAGEYGSKVTNARERIQKNFSNQILYEKTAMVLKTVIQE
ncbi:MAG: glycosyltransferase [Rivularia sp. (in: cyanobacteria)]